ncbi:MAG: calcium/sodium antiporter [Actinobacteria bacterium]|nr:calcium/sodium antiporter [Actinomycetota bacterium]
MDLLTVVWLVAGFVCLVVGAEWLVKGASSIATSFGVPPIVIGLTVVAFGTSAPEFAVSANGALTGNADVALGNVVGSNTLNILLILGLSATIGGLAIEQRLLKFDIPVLIGISGVIYLLLLNGVVGRLEGVVLFAGIVAYTAWLLRGARRPESETVTEEYEESVGKLEGSALGRALPFQLALVVVGFALLVLGSRLLVSAATDIAEAVGVSDLVIGLTVVALGTSLPELATSVLAAIRGQRDIAVGNVVGSNIFNLLAVLGGAAVLSDAGVTVNRELLRLDYPVMLAATVVLLPICWNGFMIKRWEGGLLVLFYGAYVAFLVMEAGDSSAPELFRTAMLIIVPLVMVVYSAAGFQGWRRHRAMAQR